MREPAFWWRDVGVRAHLLAPLGFIYGGIAARRMTRKGVDAGVPVICVGNFTLGGAGKTPTVIAISRMLAGAGERPFCLTRGYGGTIAGPKLVDAHADTAAQVGDEAEPLVLERELALVDDQPGGVLPGLHRRDDLVERHDLVREQVLRVVDELLVVGAEDALH